jgi:hypothetical protein
MRRIIMVVTVAGRTLAADGVPFIGSRYARLLVLSATLTAVMVVGLLAFATPSRADVACRAEIFCLEKTATPDPVTVGETLTFTITGYCTLVGGFTSCGSASLELADTLPTGLEFASASATGYGGPVFGNQPQPTCSESEGTVTCAPVVYLFDNVGTEVPFVATIEVIPTQCGTFTNTASVDKDQSVSETFTVEGCPTTKAQCKNGGYLDYTDANGNPFKNEGQCTSYAARGGQLVPTPDISLDQAGGSISGTGFTPNSPITLSGEFTPSHATFSILPGFGLSTDPTGAFTFTAGDVVDFCPTDRDESVEVTATDDEGVSVTESFPLECGT